MNSIKSYTFYQDPDTRWYVDLPEWTGPKADLEMIMGADIMLNYMSEGSGRVTLSITEEKIDGYNVLSLIKETPEYDGGGLYKLDFYQGIQIGLEVWLCEVVRFVYGHIPKELYFCKN